MCCAASPYQRGVWISKIKELKGKLKASERCQLLDEGQWRSLYMSAWLLASPQAAKELQKVREIHLLKMSKTKVNSSGLQGWFLKLEKRVEMDKNIHYYEIKQECIELFGLDSFNSTKVDIEEILRRRNGSGMGASALEVETVTLYVCALNRTDI